MFNINTVKFDAQSMADDVLEKSRVPNEKIVRHLIFNVASHYHSNRKELEIFDTWLTETPYDDVLRQWSVRIPSLSPGNPKFLNEEWCLMTLRALGLNTKEKIQDLTLTEAGISHLTTEVFKRLCTIVFAESGKIPATMSEGEQTELIAKGMVVQRVAVISLIRTAITEHLRRKRLWPKNNMFSVMSREDFRYGGDIHAICTLRSDMERICTAKLMPLLEE
jgi:hypothetical protein